VAGRGNPKWQPGESGRPSEGRDRNPGNGAGAFDEAERDFVFWFAVGGDTVPVAIDHVGEALVGFEALPFEAGAPVVEEAPRPALAPVIPELAEGLLQDVGGVQPLVGAQQELKRALALQGEIVMARQQRVLLALDE